MADVFKLLSYQQRTFLHVAEVRGNQSINGLTRLVCPLRVCILLLFHMLHVEEHEIGKTRMTCAEGHFLSEAFGLAFLLRFFHLFSDRWCSAGMHKDTRAALSPALAGAQGCP